MTGPSPSAAATGLIRIVAAVALDDEGRVLLVRKRARAFMQPGGKREPGETDLDALARELREELGCVVDLAYAQALGTFRALAVNEPGQEVEAALYHVELRGMIAAAAEIEAVAWVDPREPGELFLASLTSAVVLPLARHLGRSPQAGEEPGGAP